MQKLWNLKVVKHLKNQRFGLKWNGNSYAQVISLSTENGSQSIMCRFMYFFVQCSKYDKAERRWKKRGMGGNWGEKGTWLGKVT